MSGKNNPFYGKHHTPEANEKNRLAHLGKHPKTEFKKGQTSGKNNAKWKNGTKTHQRGYLYILTPEHPFATICGYVFEHRLVMEKHLGRYLDTKEIVHHINGVITDNRIENLMLFSNTNKHSSFHHPKGIKFHRKQPLIVH